jgi:hypothetical protein
MQSPMVQANDLNRNPFCQESTLILVVDMSQSSWLVAGFVPGIERHPLKQLDPDEKVLLQLIQRWRIHLASTPGGPARRCGRSGGDSEPRGLPIPRQKIRDLICWVIGQACQHVAKLVDRRC